MMQKQWFGLAGQLLLIAFSLLPMWLLPAANEPQTPVISAFEVPLPESGQYFRAKMAASPAFP